MNICYGEFMEKINKSPASNTFNDIIGDSQVIAEVKRKAMNAAYSNSSIIITGESGTGKELFAQAIHNESLRKEGPFVALNCAAVHPELIASQLFGYVEGAFTGAKKGGYMGKFEYAHQGTLFLDEIGELPIYAQGILLRVIEERAVTRIGSNIITPIDVRLICATNRDLKKMVRDGMFRLDLFYRINVIHLHLPSLKERITDIPLLVNYYIDYFNKFLGKNVKRVAPEVLSSLMNYFWMGNLRELRNMLECGMNNASGDILEIDDLPEDIFDDESEALIDFKKRDKLSQENDFYQAEKRNILNLMIKYNGNKSHVAADLGLARNTLYKKLRNYNLL